jgi:hypothetical protein
MRSDYLILHAVASSCTAALTIGRSDGQPECIGCHDRGALSGVGGLAICTCADIDSGGWDRHPRHGLHSGAEVGHPFST